ncbi:MAG: CpsD/CapB family tyrosine-protein kinase, partial [Gammaproteobacteria bacterium]
EPALGLSDYLRDRVPLERLLVNPNVERLVVLPGRESVANSSEMLASARMRDLVQELKRRYADRVVVFDVPALLDSDDALAFSPNVDALLLVVREGRTRKADVTRAVSVIEGVPLLGTVLNDASEPWGRER